MASSADVLPLDGVKAMSTRSASTSVSSSSSESDNANAAPRIKTTRRATAPPPRVAFVGAFGAMKRSAMSAKKSFVPQFHTIREKTSKRLQPSLSKVKSSASAAANGMQPALSRVVEGSSQGWSVFKHTLASAAPVAGKFQTMSMNVVNDVNGMFNGDASVDVVVVDDPGRACCRFLEDYKGGNARSTPTLLQAVRRRTTIADATDSTASPGERCLSQHYVLCNILLFCGDIQTLVRVSSVNAACHQFVNREKRLWRFCVRYGEIPQSIRCNYWEHMTGATKLRDASEIDFETYAMMAISKGECTELILTDVRRSYGRVLPHRGSIRPHANTEDDAISELNDILHALAGRFPDVGYCQGMDYIAAHVLNHVRRTASSRGHATSRSTSPGPENASPEDSRADLERAFWIIVALFENYGLREVFGPGLQRLQLNCFQCQRLFELAMPSLAEHFEKEKVVIEMFTVGWFQTLFLYSSVLPDAALSRIWDIFVLERSWKIVLRVALALLEIAEPFVATQPIDDVMQFFNTYAHEDVVVLDADDVLTKALRIKVTNGMLRKLKRQHTTALRHKRSLSRSS